MILPPNPTDPQVRAFGPHPTHVELRVPTPIGERCAQCDDPIVSGDSGVLMLHIIRASKTVIEPGESALVEAVWLPSHLACLLATVRGGR